MECNCNNISGGGSQLKEPRIKHVQGNVLRIAIPLTLRSLVKDGDEMVATDTDFIPSSEYPVRVVFSKGKTSYPLTATMDGNVAIVEDNGKIPIGTYDICVECRDDIGRPYRFKQGTVLQVVDKTAEAGIDEEIEYETTTWYLNAAVFLATTEIGSMSEEIEQRLETVFGAVEYDAANHAIKFYNKDRSEVLGTLDSRPFTSDGSVDDVYIDVARQVLVVVNNADAGGRRFTVPLYLIFGNYYNKTEVETRLNRVMQYTSEEISGKVTLFVPVTSSGGSLHSNIDYGAIRNAIVEENREVIVRTSGGGFLHLLGYTDSAVQFWTIFYETADDCFFCEMAVDEDNNWSYNEYPIASGGGGGSLEQVQADWAQTNISAVDYIKNKPTIPAAYDDTALAGRVSALENAGYITTETDPTVPAWAKQSTKPTYTAQEVGAMATTHPANDVTSALMSQWSAKQNALTFDNTPTDNSDNPVKSGGVKTALDAKVNTEVGKGLSTNDYTDADKSKLAGIAAGAEVNVQSDWNASSGDAAILNKPTLSTVATSGSYNDLTGKPTILTENQVQGMIDEAVENVDMTDYYDKQTVDDHIAAAIQGGVTGINAPFSLVKVGDTYYLEDNTPQLNVSVDSIVMRGNTKTATFTVSGRKLQSDISIALDGSPTGWSVSPATIAAVNGAVSETTVTVTYSGSNSDTATINISTTGKSASLDVEYKAAPVITLSKQTISMSSAADAAATATVDIVGENLETTSPLVVALSSNDFSYAVTSGSLTPSNGSVNATLTITRAASATDASATLSVSDTADDLSISASCQWTETEPEEVDAVVTRLQGYKSTDTEGSPSIGIKYRIAVVADGATHGEVHVVNSNGATGYYNGNYPGLHHYEVPLSITINGNIYDVTALRGACLGYCSTFFQVTFELDGNGRTNVKLFKNEGNTGPFVGSNAFRGTDGAGTLNIPYGVTQLEGIYAGTACSKIIIPNSVTSCGNAFNINYSSNNPKYIDYGTGVSTLPRTFGHKGLTTIVVRKDGVATMSNPNDCNQYGGTGDLPKLQVYVPTNQVSAYEANSTWAGLVSNGHIEILDIANLPNT